MIFRNSNSSATMCRRWPALWLNSIAADCFFLALISGLGGAAVSFPLKYVRKGMWYRDHSIFSGMADAVLIASCIIMGLVSTKQSGCRVVRFLTTAGIPYAHLRDHLRSCGARHVCGHLDIKHPHPEPRTPTLDFFPARERGEVGEVGKGILRRGRGVPRTRPGDYALKRRLPKWCLPLKCCLPFRYGFAAAASRPGRRGYHSGPRQSPVARLGIQQTEHGLAGFQILGRAGQVGALGHLGHVVPV